MTLLPRCAMGAGGGARGCVRLVWCLLCCVVVWGVWVRVGRRGGHGRGGVCCACVCAHDRHLDLSSNQISGSFPSAVSGLSSLT